FKQREHGIDSNDAAKHASLRDTDSGANDLLVSSCSATSPSQSPSLDVALPP
ncbi:hypothetical protein Bpfe_005969, partial [Biomphalaria pfeifferi]